MEFRNYDCRTTHRVSIKHTHTLNLAEINKIKRLALLLFIKTWLLSIRSLPFLEKEDPMKLQEQILAG